MDITSRLTLKQLRSFAVVYRHGKLASAARELGITDSAVSVLIRQIETTLGIRLFDRTTRSLEPTRAADEIIGVATRILQDVETLAANASELNAGTHGSVNLAATPTTALAFLPEAVRTFAHIYSNIRLNIDDCAPNQFWPLIQSEKVEFGIGTPPEKEQECHSTPLIDDELCLVCASDHEFAERHHVTWKELRGQKLVNLRPGYGVRQLIDKTAARVGVELETVHEAGFLDTVVWMASAGLGVGILPVTLARLHRYRQVTVVPLIEPEIRRPISIVTKSGKSLSPACELFVNVLTQQVRAQMTIPVAAAE